MADHDAQCEHYARQGPRLPVTPCGCPERAGRSRALWLAYQSPHDHPYTDPGDGRVECQTCGKWVNLVIHSCKGVPVTEAAWLRRFPSDDARSQHG